MAVMNRFASVTESWKQTEPWVIFKYCFLSEGILLEQVFLLNTSLFPLPLGNRTVLRSAVSGLPQHSLFLSFTPFWSLKLPLLSWLHAVKVHSVCCATKSLLLRFTTLLWPGCSVSSPPISNGKRLQCFKHHQILSTITFALMEGQQTSPQTGDRRISYLMHLRAALAGWLSPVLHHGIRAC